MHGPDTFPGERGSTARDSIEGRPSICKHCGQSVGTTWEELDMGTGVMCFFRTLDWHLAHIKNVAQQCRGSHAVIEQI